MPIFRVTIEETHHEDFEEIYHAQREAFCTRVYEVEADNEEDAEEMAHNDEGHLVSEDWDYGDVVDSEYYESGDTFDSHYMGCEIEVETLEDYEERFRQLQREREETMRRAREAHANWLAARRLMRESGMRPDAKPSWEV